MKSFTDIEQSKKLAKILPLKSADMGYIPSEEDDDGNTLYTAEFKSEFIFGEDCVPCWSLAALVDVLPADWWDCNKHCFFEIYKQQDDKQDKSSILYIVRYFYYKEEDFNSKNPNFNRITHISFMSSNIIDACVNMIVKLHKHKNL